MECLWYDRHSSNKFKLGSIITFTLQIKKARPLTDQFSQGYTIGLFKIL